MSHGGRAKMQRPIFILGLQRGGTNQFLNLLRSHPDTIWPDGEFHEVLRPSSRHSKLEAMQVLLSYLPILVRHGDILKPAKRDGLERLGDREVRWIARRLLRATGANEAEVRRYKQELERRRFHLQSAGQPRMVVKLVNYNVRFARDLRTAFPDARFVAVARQASGVCESMMSRGAKIDDVISLYNYFGHTMRSLAEEGLPIEVFRFEDLLENVRSVAEDVYRFCELDARALTGICMQDKQRVTGMQDQVIAVEKTDIFYSFDHAQEHMRREVNATATSRLTPANLKQIARECDEIGPNLAGAAQASIAI